MLVRIPKIYNFNIDLILLSLTINGPQTPENIRFGVNSDKSILFNQSITQP